MALLPPRRTGSGFTLVELLIAIALTVIILGMLVAAFTGTQEIISRVRGRIEAFQNVRRMIDLLGVDIGNMLKTSDMEFFRDRVGVGSQGHFDEGSGEELSGLRLASDIFGDVPGFNQPSYFASPVVVMSEYTVDGVTRPNDAIYLRTTTTIQGKVRSALIRYQLSNLDQRFPTLRRLKFFQKLVADPLAPPLLIRDPPLVPDPDDPDGDLVDDPGDVVCTGVIEMEVEIFFKENTVSGKGSYLDPREILSLGTIPSLKPGDLNDLVPPANTLPTVLQTLFEGDDGILEVRKNADAVFYTRSGSQFPQVRPGDRIFIEPTGNAFGVESLPPRDYRILSLISEDPDDRDSENIDFNDPSVRTVMRFEEAIDFTGIAADEEETVGDFTFEKFDVRYRLGWLPSSIRIRFRIRDRFDREEFDVVRVFKILGS